MKNTKKYLSFLLGLMLMFILIGCSSTSENTTPTIAPQQTEANNSITKEVSKQKETASVSKNNKAVTGELKVNFIDVGQADSILVQQGNSSMHYRCRE